MHIIINRDAVCAADDMSRHREKFTVPDGITTTLRWALILPKIVVL